MRKTGSGSEQWATMWPSSPAPPSAACNGVNVTHWHTSTRANNGSWQAGSTSGESNKLLIYRLNWKWRIFSLSSNTSKREPSNFTQRFQCWCVCFWQVVQIDWSGFHSMDQSEPSDPDWSETCSVHDWRYFEISTFNLQCGPKLFITLAHLDFAMFSFHLFLTGNETGIALKIMKWHVGIFSFENCKLSKNSLWAPQ